AEDVLVEESAYNEEEANLQRALELSLKEQAERTQGPDHLVVIREPDFGIIQPLPDVQGKGKEEVIDEQAAHDLLTLLNPKHKSSIDQFIFQRRTPMPTEASGHAESPSLDAELVLTDSEMESDNVVSKIDTGDQDEESQPQSCHVVHVGPNLEHIDLESTDALTRQNLEQIDEEFTTTAYPDVQENLKLPSEDPMILKEPISSTRTLSSYKTSKKNSSSQISSSWRSNRKKNQGKPMLKQRFSQWFWSPFIKTPPRFL
nr:hypothetical protein [Tanacetum cinerariifolium]GEY72345.1 hypothetical protein [Tanacetum cinerariifolium]